jgi:hypothetical protein
MNVKQLGQLESDIYNSIVGKMLEKGYLKKSEEKPYDKFLSYINTQEGKDDIGELCAGVQTQFNKSLRCDGKFTFDSNGNIVCSGIGDCIRKGRKKCAVATRIANDMRLDAIVHEREETKAAKKDVKRLTVDEITARERGARR